jgi:hypothetical protein
MDSRRLLLLVIFAGVCPILCAQSPTYALGRAPTAEEIRAWDISISPTGKELPAGHGTAKEGAPLYVQKGCAGCHGANGSGGAAPVLIRRPGSPEGPVRGAMPGMQMGQGGVMGQHSPFATTIWDYISRGMPLNKEGTLTPNEVYAITAFLLYKNGVLQSEDEVLDAQTLPKVKMPNSSGFVVLEWKPGTPRLLSYP